MGRWSLAHLVQPAHGCAVTGVPDLGRGFRIKATIVLTDGYEGNGSLSRDLQQFVLQNTASYKCPKIFEYVAEMPKTISGKIMRNQL